MTSPHLKISLCTLLCAVLSVHCAEYNPNQAKQEMELVDYLKTKKPHYNVPSDVTHILLFIELKQILETDEMSGLMTAKFTTYMMYRTQTSSWDPAQFSDIKFLTIDPGIMWAPDITLMEAVEVLNDFQHKDTLMFNGVVRTMYMEITAKLSCHFDVSQFPWDEQTCYITYLTPLGFYNITGVELRTTTDEMPMEFFAENDYWDLEPPIKLSTIILAKHEDNSTFLSSAVSATINLRRRPKFYLVVVILPNIVIYLLSSLVFFVPVESGEKISYIVTIFLAEIVNVGALSGMFPASSSGFPKVGYFTIAVTLHLSLLCVSTIAVVNFNLYAEDKKTNKFVDWVVGSRFVRYFDLNKRQTREPADDDDDFPTSNIDESNINALGGKKKVGVSKKISDYELQERKKSAENNRRKSMALFRYEEDEEVQETFVPWKIFAEALDFFCFLVHMVLTFLVFLYFIVQFRLMATYRI